MILCTHSTLASNSKFAAISAIYASIHDENPNAEQSVTAYEHRRDFGFIHLFHDLYHTFCPIMPVYLPVHRCGTRCDDCYNYAYSFFRPWHLQHDFFLLRGLGKTCLSLSVTFFFVLMIGIIFISRRIIAYCERCVLFVVTMILFCNFWQKYCTRVIGYFQWNHNGNRRDVE